MLKRVHSGLTQQARLDSTRRFDEGRFEVRRGGRQRRLRKSPFALFGWAAAVLRLMQEGESRLPRLSRHLNVQRDLRQSRRQVPSLLPEAELSRSPNGFSACRVAGEAKRKETVVESSRAATRLAKPIRQLRAGGGSQLSSNCGLLCLLLRALPLLPRHRCLPFPSPTSKEGELPNRVFVTNHQPRTEQIIMRERITFIQKLGDSIESSALQVSGSQVRGPDVQAVREDRLTVALDELPSELHSLLKGSHELHIRWVSPVAYDTVSPLLARLPPGFHLFFTPGKGVDATS